MTIGVDAGALSISDERLKVGVYKVTLRLLEELAKRDRKNAYRLYSFKPIGEGIVSSLGRRFTNVILPPLAWSTFWLPRQLHKRPVDVFLGLSQSLPHSPSYNIGFVYDLGFLHRPQDYPRSAKKLRKQTDALVGRADRLVTISRTVAADIQARYAIPKAKIVVAYPGVDSIFTPRGATFRHHCPYFLYVGSLKRGKNVPALIAAFSRLLAMQSKTLDLFIAGSDYWLDPGIEKAIKDYRVEHRVRMLGFVSDNKLCEYYRGAVAFVSPSQTEGFCLPAVEAMASGCPVMVSDIAVMREVVGSAGLYVIPADTPLFAQALCRLVEDSKLRDVLRARGIQRARTYSWKRFAKTIYELYCF